MIGAVLLAGCSQDDVALEVTPEEPVALNFCITEAETNYTDGSTRAGQTASTRAGHTGAMNSEDLYTTGFGIFASVTADKKPNLMFNQEATYTHVGDMENLTDGYWTYSPLKYWPADRSHFYISAYAPYQDYPLVPDAEETGIIGIANNTVTPYVDYRRCEKPNEVVDLLWFYEEPDTIPAASAGYAAGTLRMKMRHALTRLEINVKLASAPAEGTKVLIDSIALTGTMAKTGRLSLSTQETEGEGLEKKYYPVWSDQTNDKDGGGDDTPPHLRHRQRRQQCPELRHHRPSGALYKRTALRLAARRSEGRRPPDARCGRGAAERPQHRRPQDIHLPDTAGRTLEPDGESAIP